jgi:hypothetical protein
MPPHEPQLNRRVYSVYHKLQFETIPTLLELKKQPLKLYLALCQYADIETGICWPGYARLRKECKIYSGSEMRNAIRDLENAELVATWMEGNKRHYQILE